MSNWSGGSSSLKTKEKIICCLVQTVIDPPDEGNKYVMFRDLIIISREIVNIM